jgi:hypothetical protein
MSCFGSSCTAVITLTPEEVEKKRKEFEDELKVFLDGFNESIRKEAKKNDESYYPMVSDDIKISDLKGTYSKNFNNIKRSLIFEKLIYGTYYTKLFMRYYKIDPRITKGFMNPQRFGGGFTRKRGRKLKKTKRRRSSRRRH